jgi:UDP-4-amino-4,6-dideoxy-N-acetyl-beta-L-altrosamine N-acetyltransferase
MALRALFLTEAGSHTGMGHLVRCSALADALAERGVDCEFWVNLSGQPPAFATPHRLTYRMWHSGQPPQPEELLTADFVVVDSYLADPRALQQIADAACGTLMLDDFVRCRYPQQAVVLNGTPGAESLAYSHLAPRLLLGSPFALLRAPFRQVPPPAIKLQIETVLVSLGGGDGAAQVRWLVELLQSLRPHWRILALAAGDKYLEQAEWYDGLSAEQMVVLMQRVDLAISAGGQTLFELAALGVPTLALLQADNQTLNISHGAAAGFLCDLGPLSAADLKSHLATALQRVEEQAIRVRMSAAGQRWIDGQGAERVADFLLRSRPIAQLFQDLPEQDLLEILAWRNSDAVRLHMVHDEIITTESHLAFCRTLAGNPVRLCWRVSHLGEKIGVVALTLSPDGTEAELGIYKNPAVPYKVGAILMHGLFEEAQQRKLDRIYLKVKQANQKAQRLYERYGFQRLGSDGGYVRMEKKLNQA